MTHVRPVARGSTVRQTPFVGQAVAERQLRPERGVELEHGAVRLAGDGAHRAGGFNQSCEHRLRSGRRRRAARRGSARGRRARTTAASPTARRPGRASPATRSSGRDRRRRPSTPPRAAPARLRAAATSRRARADPATAGARGVVGRAAITSAPRAAQRRGPIGVRGAGRRRSSPPARARRSSVSQSRAVGGVRSRRSKITRISGRARHTSRAVSTRIVGEQRARSDADRRDLGPHALRVPLRRGAADRRPRARRRGDRAVEAHRDLGDHERPAARRTLVTNTSLRRRASASRTPTVDLDAALAQVARSRGRRPRETDPRIAATTRRTPASATATAHGPVRPVWLHGSSVQ